MNDKEKVNHCYIQMLEAMINKDKSQLDKVISNQFVLTHMTGLNQNKDEFINSVLDGTLNYFDAQHKSIEILINDNKAQLIGESLLEAAVYGGKRRIWPLKFQLKLEKKNDKWKIIESSIFAN